MILISQLDGPTFDADLTVAIHPAFKDWTQPLDCESLEPRENSPKPKVDLNPRGHCIDLTFIEIDWVQRRVHDMSSE